MIDRYKRLIVGENLIEHTDMIEDGFTVKGRPMIISSSFLLDHEQIDGRRWVIETHLTDKNEIKINTYLASPKTDYEAAMKAHAELIDAQPELTEEDIVDAELEHISTRLDEISDKYPEKVDQAITAASAAVAVRLEPKDDTEPIKDGEPIKVGG